MKRTFFQTLALTGVLAISGAVFTASAEEHLSVRVPFSFVVAGKSFAPGQYQVDESNNGVIIVQGAGQAAAVLSVPNEYPKTGSSTGLRFTNAHQLVGVQVEGEVGRSISATYHEHKLAVSAR